MRGDSRLHLRGRGAFKPPQAKRRGAGGTGRPRRAVPGAAQGWARADGRFGRVLGLLEVADAELLEQEATLPWPAVPCSALLLATHTVGEGVTVALLVVAVLDHVVLSLVVFVVLLCRDPQGDS